MMNQGNGKKPNGGNKHGLIPPNLSTALELQSFEEFKLELDGCSHDRNVHTLLMKMLCEKNFKAKDDTRKLEHLVKISLTK